MQQAGWEASASEHTPCLKRAVPLRPSQPLASGEHGLDVVVIWWFRKIQMSGLKTLWGMMACLCDPRTQEAETGGLQLAVELYVRARSQKNPSLLKKVLGSQPFPWMSREAGFGLHTVLVSASNLALWAQGVSDDKTRMQATWCMGQNRPHLLVRSLYLPLEDTFIMRTKQLLLSSNCWPDRKRWLRPHTEQSRQPAAGKPQLASVAGRTAGGRTPTHVEMRASAVAQDS